jgi:putative membrane protein
MLPASIQKNDKTANLLIITFSVIVFVVVVFLSKVKLEVNLPFNVHLFAKINAVINSMVSFLLLVGLLAVKRGNYQLHKKVMMTSMVLSFLFLVSYICHHLFSDSTTYGGVGAMRLLYFGILISHIFFY